MIFPLQWVPVMIPMAPMIRMISCLEFFFSSGWMGCVGSGKIDVHLWFWIWGGCFRLHLGQRDKKKLIASDQAAIFEGKCWVSLAGYPSSCSPNITPFCPIQPLYNPYIGGILLVYMSRTLQGYPTFPFEISETCLCGKSPWTCRSPYFNDCGDVFLTLKTYPETRQDWSY